MRQVWDRFLGNAFRWLVLALLGAWLAGCATSSYPPAPATAASPAPPAPSATVPAPPANAPADAPQFTEEVSVSWILVPVIVKSQ